MKTNIALRTLSDVTGSQWGLVTTQQAEQIGVSRLVLSRLHQQGQLDRVRQGVYHDSGSPSSFETELQAHWLSFKPAVLAEKRLRNLEGEAIVASTTASWLRQEGDFLPEPFSFYYPQRVQKASTGIKVIKAEVPVSDVEIAHGLPTTTKTRTLLDLFGQGRDLGGMQSIIQDGGIKELDLERIRSASKIIAARYGLPAKAFAKQLEQILRSSLVATIEQLGLATVTGMDLKADFSALNKSADALRAQFADLQTNLDLRIDMPDVESYVESVEQLKKQIKNIAKQFT